MKKGARLFLIIFLLIFIIVILDMVYILKFSKPLFILNKTHHLTCDIYEGLLYNIYDCAEYNKPKFRFKWQKYEFNNYSSYFDVIDESKSCDNKEEEIYRDKENIYYLPCSKSEYIKIKFSNGDTYKLKEAIEKKLVTMDDLIKNNLELNIKKREEETMKMNLIIGSDTYEVILEDNETVKELLNMLPIEMEMQELNGNEKYYYLDKALKTNKSVPSEISKGDIYLYGDNCLVLFYQSFTTSFSYTKIGHVNNLKDLGKENIKVTLK